MRSARITLGVFVLAVAFGLVSLALPLPQTPVTRPSFEVASIKPYEEPPLGQPRFYGFSNQPGGRFRATGTTLKMLMTFAYRVRDFQVVGGPDWITADRFEIVAKAEDGTVPPQTGKPDLNVPDTIALMLQSLIDERFQLKMHRETRELPVYELVAAKDGSKLQLSEDQSPPKPPEPGAARPPAPPPQRGFPPPPPGRGGIMMGGRPEGMILQATAVKLSDLVTALSSQLGRTVIDKTGLQGLYDIKLQWTPDIGQGARPVGAIAPPGESAPPPADLSGPTIFTAVQEQLGLRLVSTKGPVEVIVIDSVQKPTLN
jgi:uncharacterized protein (TIGR03435 family)